jgi:hypothetical protein
MRRIPYSKWLAGDQDYVAELSLANLRKLLAVARAAEKALKASHYDAEHPPFDMRELITALDKLNKGRK